MNETMTNTLSDFAVETLICRRCGIRKPVSEFEKDYRRKSGYHGSCRDCHKEILDGGLVGRSVKQERVFTKDGLMILKVSKQSGRVEPELQTWRECKTSLANCKEAVPYEVSKVL